MPTVSYEADILTFARSGTDMQGVGLGDRVLLVDTTFTPDLRLAGRVLQLEEDLLDPALTTVTIGNIIERLTASNRTAEQRLERVVAESAAWNTSSQQISQNAGKWDQVAQTVVDNATQWNQASETVSSKQSGWDTAASTVSQHADEWNTAATSIAEDKTKWDEAFITAGNLTQSVQQSVTETTLRHGDLAVTLGERISLTDQSGTWVFENGAFVKQ